MHTASAGSKTEREATAKANLVLNARLSNKKQGTSGFKDPATHMSF